VIYQLTGVLVRKEPTRAILDVGGVGYQVDIPISTFEMIGDVGREVTLLTHMVVREDSMQLYGFSTESERELFGLFLSVSGVGPRLALSLLSRSSCDELRRAISESDMDSLTSVSGVGKKTAQRLVVELREKVGVLVETGERESTEIAADAVRALMSLGFSRSESVKAVRSVAGEREADDNVEDLVRKALAFADNK
jgi:Holliday junction DNA helicase RuvA